MTTSDACKLLLLSAAYLLVQRPGQASCVEANVGCRVKITQQLYCFQESSLHVLCRKCSMHRWHSMRPFCFLLLLSQKRAVSLQATFRLCSVHPSMLVPLLHCTRQMRATADAAKTGHACDGGGGCTVSILRHTCFALMSDAVVFL